MRALAAHWPDIEALDESSMVRERHRFRRGIENWIVQTYLRLRRPLRAKGIEARIADAFEPGALCVAHRDDLNRYADPLHDCFVVGARADRPPVRVADLEVVQNELQVDSPRARLIPHWPQPGLVRRDVSRGTRVERIAYMGRVGSVPAWYSDAAFSAGLGKMGIELEIRDDRWHDYSGIDVLLAHRSETPVLLRNKPASKLVNAWLAGVPSVLSPEPAFEQLRRGPLDFIATRDARSTLEALGAIASDAALYRAMVENGLARGRDFDVEAVRGRWMSFFLDDALPAFERWRAGMDPWPVRYARHLASMTAQKLAARRFRRQERRDRAGLGSA